MPITARASRTFRTREATINCRRAAGEITAWRAVEVRGQEEEWEVEARTFAGTPGTLGELTSTR
jgi:hypothetical protein